MLYGFQSSSKGIAVTQPRQSLQPLVSTDIGRKATLGFRARDVSRNHHHPDWGTNLPTEQDARQNGGVRRIKCANRAVVRLRVRHGAHHPWLYNTALAV